MDEVELEFKRFSKEKQEQVRQLVAYTTLMGLTGKDLVSIGGKLDRIEKRKDLEHRLSIVNSYSIRPIGVDKDTSKRFKIEINGVNYNVYDDYYGCIVKNLKTNRQSTFHLNQLDWGRSGWKSRIRYQFLWALHTGQVTLP